MDIAIKIGFKVVRHSRSGILYSAIDGPTGTVLVYDTEEWTVPRNGFGPLCVFDTCDNALDWTKYKVGLEIHHCKYIESYRSYPYAIDVSGALMKATMEMPRGTIFADAVILLE